ncbi:hypothetical protein [Streptomyces sp. NPDC003006]
MSGTGVEVGAQAARSRALAVLRLRSRALAVALLPAAAAVVLLAGRVTGHIGGGSWDVVRWIVTALALLVLLAAAGVALVVARARPALSPTVPIAEESAPDLYRLVRDLADRLDVPAPSAIALTPDCDSWLEDRTHPAHGPPARARGTSGARGASGATSGEAPDGVRDASASAPERPPSTAPVLVIGSPFLWWMRVGELRAVLAPVVAGTGPSAHPDIAAARRFVRGLDAAVAVASAPGRGPVTRTVLGGVGWIARLLLRNCRVHAAEMERGVAAAAAERAQTVDYGVRIVAQEQVGLAYAGWDRLLTRVALPAWRMGRWPSRLDAGVVSALTELSRRDRLAEGFASRLGERPACDLLEEPGSVDEAASLLAARLFHGGPAEQSPDWAPVAWQEYPDEVVDRKWRMDAARLHRVLDSLDTDHSADPTAPDPEGATLARVLDHLTSHSVAYEASTPPEAEAEAEAVAHAAGSYDAAGARTAGAYDAAGPAADTPCAADPRAADARDSDARDTDGRDLEGHRAAGARDAAAHDAAAYDGGERETDGRDLEGHRAAAARDAAAHDAAAYDAGERETDGRDPDGHRAAAAPDAGAHDAAADDPGAWDTDGRDLEGHCAAAARDAAAHDAVADDPGARDVYGRHPEGHRAAAVHDAAAHDATARDADAHEAAARDADAHEAAVRDSEAHGMAPHGMAPHGMAPVGMAPHGVDADIDPDDADDADDPDPDDPDPHDEGPSGILAAGLSAELAREEAAAPPRPAPAGQGPDEALWDDGALPLFPLQPPRTGRELLADHVTAMVCCAAVDTAGAVPGLDWLDGPALLVDGERAADLAPRVLRLVEHGDPSALREWLTRLGVRQEKPVRLV